MKGRKSIGESREGSKMPKLSTFSIKEIFLDSFFFLKSKSEKKVDLRNQSKQANKQIRKRNRRLERKKSQTNKKEKRNLTKQAKESKSVTFSQSVEATSSRSTQSLVQQLHNLKEYGQLNLQRTTRTSRIRNQQGKETHLALHESHSYSHYCCCDFDRVHPVKAAT